MAGQADGRTGGRKLSGAGLFSWPTRLERQIAVRYLQTRKVSKQLSLNTLISVGGVAVGTMALIVVLGVMNGLRNDLRERILVANPHLRVLTFGAGLRLDDWARVRDEVLKDPDVLAVAPEVLTASLISAGHDFSDGVHILGFETDTGKMSVTSLPQSITKGDLSFKTTLNDVDGGILLGRRLASRLSVFPGDVVTLASPSETKVNSALGVAVPQYWHFEVTGLFDTGMYQYDNEFVVIPRALAQKFAGLGDAVSGLAVRLRDPWRAPEVGRRLDDRLGYPYRTLDWQTQNATLFSALKLEKVAMGLIIFFIMIVAAFNIVGTLTMVVADKTREIGILQAMGLTRAGIGRIFMIQGTIIGVVGVAIGLAGGLVVSWGIDRGHWIRIDPAVYFIDHLPVHIELWDVVVVVAASLLLAQVATLHPSRSAARLTPVEAIRHE
jgi:lipoprotein-releasing system permease protein